jgi:Mrp family chromosome partitioning ATPase/uncharacterized protein involved in exopolysaccharide biosynthesis
VVPGSGDETQGEELKLPFDLGTILVAIRRRVVLLGIVFVVAAVAGSLGGVLLGQRTYQAETVLRYTPVGDRLASAGTALQTEQNQVKITQNLARVRMLLSIEASLEQIGAALQVSTANNSSLMLIKATWNDGAMAAAMANTLRDVYLDAWLAAQAVNLRLLYDHAASELKNFDAQAEKLNQRIADLENKARAEQEEAAKDGKGNASFKLQSLQQAIASDQSRRANMAELARRESEIARARSLRSQDLISPAEFERTMASYKSQAAVTVDTGQIKAWKSQIDQLSQQLASQSPEGSSTLSLLQATLLRSYDLDMQRVTSQQKVADIGEALDLLTEVKARNAVLERPSGALSPLLDSGTGGTGDGEPVQDRMSLQHTLTRVLTAYGSEGGVFEVIAEAEEPVFPTKSTRKLLAIAIFLGLLGLGVVVLSMFEALHPTMRSAAEVRAKLDLPVLGVLPWVRREGLVLPWKPGGHLVESARLLAERLRAKSPKAGARLVITSAGRGDGRTLVTSHLAAALGQRGERVLLVAEIRDPRNPTGLEYLSPVGQDAVRGLGDLVQGERVAMSDIVLKTVLTGVALLPRGRSMTAPEPLGGSLMHDVLEEASARASIVLVTAAPALPTVDAELVARHCDGVILAVRAGTTRASEVRRAVKRLELAKTPVLGVVLVGVRRAFLDLD